MNIRINIPIIVILFLVFGWQQQILSADLIANDRPVVSGQTTGPTADAAISATSNAVSGESVQLPRFLLFLGRLHPVVLHLPIGFFIVLFLLEGWMLYQRSGEMEAAAWLVLFLLCGGTFFAVVFGIFLSWSGDYDPSILFWHKWLGIGLAVFSFAALVVKGLWWLDRKVMFQRIYHAILGISLMMLIAGGHQGASLTHGPAYLTQYLPNWLGGGAEEVQVADAGATHNIGSEFETAIQPILQKRCFECHGDTKQEGGLNLASRSMAMAGGRSGRAAITPGDALRSHLVERITLPPESNLAMPPAGKARLLPSEVMLVMDWINRGAKWFSPLEKLEQTVPPPSPADIDTLVARGIEAAPLAAGSALLRVDLAGFSGTLDDEIAASVRPLSKQITWLNLSRRELTPAIVSLITELPHLTRLDLSLTNASDGDLAGLAKLTYLESLNLYGTNVSDEGLKALEPLSQLQNLYVWRTQVTNDGVEQLKKAIPGLKIDLGGIDALPEIAAADAPS